MCDGGGKGEWSATGPFLPSLVLLSDVVGTEPTTWPKAQAALLSEDSPSSPLWRDASPEASGPLVHGVAFSRGRWEAGAGLRIPADADPSRDPSVFRSGLVGSSPFFRAIEPGSSDPPISEGDGLVALRRGGASMPLID